MGSDRWVKQKAIPADHGKMLGSKSDFINQHPPSVATGLPARFHEVPPNYVMVVLIRHIVGRHD
jgi:hypothetical protein